MYHIIVNPASGSGRGKDRCRELTRLMNLAKLTYITKKTRSADDVKTYAKKATQPGDEEKHLILVGGDGTLNHCVNGIVDLEHTDLTYLPSGTSNDFSRSLSLSYDPCSAVEALRQKGSIIPIDLCSVRTKTGKVRFTVSSGLGYDADVCREAMHTPMKRLFNRLRLGKLLYGFIALKQFLFMRPCGCTLYLDDQEPIRFENVLLAAFMNQPYEGGGFPFAPDADPSDGLMDICIAGNIPKWYALVLLPSVVAKKQYGKKGFYHYRASRATIVTDKPLTTHTDGEIIGSFSKLTYECGKETLRLRKTTDKA